MAGVGSLARVQVFGGARKGGGGVREETGVGGGEREEGQKKWGGGLVSFPSFYINSGQN